jgi:hypothetical protein
MMRDPDRGGSPGSKVTARSPVMNMPSKVGPGLCAPTDFVATFIAVMVSTTERGASL